MICLRWQSKSEAGIEMRRKAAAPEARARLPGLMRDTKIFIFLFEDMMLQPQKPWQPHSEASPALRNLPPSLQPEHHLWVQCLCLPMVRVCASPSCSSWLLWADSWALPQTCLSWATLPIWHPNWSQPLVTWHIINPRAPTRNQSQLWGCWGLGLSPPSFGGENHEGESIDTFWEAKAAKRREHP